MKPLIYTTQAIKDLESIALYIALENPKRARSFTTELRQKAEKLSSHPKLYAKRDDLYPGLRMAVHGNYNIYYCELSEEILVARILHAARNIPRLFDS